MKKIILALSLLFLTGCLPQQPIINYQKTDLFPENFRTVVIRNYYEITNPNAMTLQGKISYSLSVEKRQLFSGRSQAIEAPGKETAMFYIDSAVDLPEALGSSSFLLEDLKKGKEFLNYELKGNYATSFAGIPFNIPLNVIGKIPLPKIPQINLLSLKIKNISLTSVVIAVTAKVINTNDFELGLKPFIYNLKVDGVQLLDNVAANSLTIEKQAAKNITLDFDLDLNKIDGKLLEQIKNGSIAGQLELEKINF